MRQPDKPMRTAILCVNEDKTIHTALRALLNNIIRSTCQVEAAYQDDAPRIKQNRIDLASNARKFTTSGSVHVTRRELCGRSCMESGMDDCMAKAVNLEVLRSVLGRFAAPLDVVGHFSVRTE